MELITILNRCHRFRGFVYHRARFSPDQKSIEVSVRPRKGSAAICRRCHQPARGYDHLAEQRFEFIPLWGFLEEASMNCIYCQGQMKRGAAPFHVDRHGYHLVWNAVPAWVCTQGGEVYFEEAEVTAVQNAIQALDA